MYIIKNALCSIKAAKLRTLILAVVAMVLSAIVCFCLKDVQSGAGGAGGNPFGDNPFESGGGFEAFWNGEAPGETEGTEGTEEGQMPGFFGNPFEGFPMEEEPEESSELESSELTAEFIPEEATETEEEPSSMEESEVQEPPEGMDGFMGFGGEGFAAPEGFEGFTAPEGEEFTAPEGESAEGFTAPEGFEGFPAFEGFEGFTAPEGEEFTAPEGEGFEGFTAPEGEEFGGFGGFGGFGDFTMPEGEGGFAPPDGFTPPDGTEEAAPGDGSEMTAPVEAEEEAVPDSRVEAAEGEEAGMPPFDFEGFGQPGMDESFEEPSALEEFLNSLNVSLGMLGLVFLASLVILFVSGGILARCRRNETLVLAVIGLRRGQIGWQYFLEHLLTVIVAAAVAVGVCAVVLDDLSGLVILEMVPVAVLYALISAILPIRSARRTDPVKVLAEKA